MFKVWQASHIFVSNKYVIVVASRSKHYFAFPSQDFQLPHKYPKIEYPERRKLGFKEKVPQPPPGSRIQKMPKQLIDMRGPESTHTFLLHKQYGIRALQGGQLHHGHFEMVRNTINRKLDESRMFAVWRIDAPWKPITHKGQGHRMGGGKGAIDHYTTPIKAGRIIIEFGGACEYREVFPFLLRVAQKLPFKADVVCQDALEREELTNKQLIEDNVNPFTFEYCVKNNLSGCRKWVSPYDYFWFNKFR